MRNLIIAFGLIACSSLHAATETNSRNSVEIDNYLQNLQKEIQKQQTQVDALKNQLERTDVVTPGYVVTQFDNAYTMLNVKKTLYANFVGTASIQSPIVRAKLLQIFQKDIVSPGDLSELQALVTQERPKYQNAQPTTGQPAPSLEFTSDRPGFTGRVATPAPAGN